MKTVFFFFLICVFSQTFRSIPLHKTTEQRSQMIASETQLKGLQVQPGFLRNHLTYAFMLCVHIWCPPPPLHPPVTCGAHGYTSNIWSFYLFFYFLYDTFFYFMGHIYFLCNLSSERHARTHTHSFNNKQYGPLNATKHP